MIKRRTLLAAGAGLTAAGASLAAVGTAEARPKRRRYGTAPWDRLRASLTGDLVLPGDADYDRARLLANAQFDDIRPQAVVYAETSQDVATAMLFAQDHSLHTAVRSGGHSYGGWSTTEGLVINLTRLNRVHAGPGQVCLGPGVQAVDVLPRLSPYGISVPAGFCATVSPGGFLTGGGTGWQYRKYGPASDRLLSARVVLADGRIVTASKDRNADLLWALRGGGGGNFGVVTEFRMAPTPITRVVHYTLTWTWDHAQRAVPGYLEWSRQASADLACGGLVRLPDARPGALPTIIVSGVHFGTVEQLEAELALLTSLVGVAPATRAVQEMTYERAMMRVFGCEDKTVDACHTTGSNPEATIPRQAWVKNRGRMFSRVLPQTGVDEFLAAFDADRRAGQSRVVSLLGLGKNANLPAVDATAWPHRDALYSATLTVSLASSTPPAEERAAAESWLNGLFDAIDGYSNGRSYVNFPDTELSDYAHAYYGPNLPRLSGVKRKYDPYGFFTFPQAVPA
ncbi:FAD-binding oxidoreductase [Streptomyces sp. NPDC006610]|jgi:FAD/FMN-containing dehydrogenase|uniref:FAD-binding oxidoreductase n=1 Tax=Streptomyces sp. NPDC006610 TaxID=3154584 RepID=UPI0033A258D8